jgi:hypothetical protein
VTGNYNSLNDIAARWEARDEEVTEIMFIETFHYKACDEKDTPRGTIISPPGEIGKKNK